MTKDAKGRMVIVKYMTSTKDLTKQEELDVEKLLRVRFVLSDQPDDYVDVMLDVRGDRVLDIRGGRAVSLLPITSNHVAITTDFLRVGNQ